MNRPNTPRRQRQAPAQQSPKAAHQPDAQPPVQVLDTHAEEKGEPPVQADPMPAPDNAPAGEPRLERFSLVAALGEVNPDWDQRLRQPILEKSEALSDAIGLVQKAVKAVGAFPEDAPVEAILINDSGLNEGKIDGRTVFVFVDTVSGGALQLYGPGGVRLPLQSPSKGRAIVADNCTGFALDPTHGRTPRAVLLFRIQAAQQ